jgi:hypothetical protein
MGYVMSPRPGQLWERLMIPPALCQTSLLQHLANEEGVHMDVLALSLHNGIGKVHQVIKLGSKVPGLLCLCLQRGLSCQKVKSCSRSGNRQSCTCQKSAQTS